MRERQIHENNTDEKTVINKKLLENGFLEIEAITQFWEDSDWVNDWKYLYKYRSLTKITEDLSLINYYTLSNNYPNPFNRVTTIKYSIPIVETHRDASLRRVTLKVYNILGREIRILVNKYKSAGSYKLNWNAANLPSGVYFYRIQAGDFVQTKKMVLLR